MLYGGSLVCVFCRVGSMWWWSCAVGTGVGVECHGGDMWRSGSGLLHRWHGPGKRPVLAITVVDQQWAVARQQYWFCSMKRLQTRLKQAKDVWFFFYLITFILFYFLFKGTSICYKHLSREFLKEKKDWKWTRSWITHWDPGQVFSICGCFKAFRNHPWGKG